MRVGLMTNPVSSLDRFLYRALVRGIRDRGWTLDHSHGLHYPIEELKPGCLDAYVVWIISKRQSELVAQSKVPAVSFTYHMRSPEVHQITHDQRKIGERAAEHLINLGVQSVAILGHHNLAYSVERVAGFNARWGKERARALVFDTGMKMRDFPVRLVSQWEKAGGVDAFFCATDETALFAINAMETIGVRVPRDLAVLGVGNEEIHSLCLGRSISSVVLDHHGIAVGVLKALEKIESEPDGEKLFEFVPPLDIFPGETARRVLPKHEGLRSAAEVLEQNDLRDVDLNRLAEVARMSRRNFERLYKEATGTSPGVAIREARIGLARRFLADPEMTIETIAEVCGYADRHHFSVRFKKDTGETPAAYRAQFERQKY